MKARIEPSASVQLFPNLYLMRPHHTVGWRICWGQEPPITMRTTGRTNKWQLIGLSCWAAANGNLLDTTGLSNPGISSGPSTSSPDAASWSNKPRIVGLFSQAGWSIRCRFPTSSHYADLPVKFGDYSTATHTTKRPNSNSNHVFTGHRPQNNKLTNNSNITVIIEPPANKYVTKKCLLNRPHANVPSGHISSNRLTITFRRPRHRNTNP